MKNCPSCGSQMPENALACAYCGGAYRPDGRFETPWDVEMARMVEQRDRRVARAERFGVLGKPIPHLFLEGKAGCLVSAVGLLLLSAMLAAALVGITS